VKKNLNSAEFDDSKFLLIKSDIKKICKPFKNCNNNNNNIINELL